MNGVLVCTYVADYVYDIVRPYPVDHVVEDFKGFVTDIFKLKAKLFRSIHGFDIRVVKTVTDGFGYCKVDNSVTP